MSSPSGGALNHAWRVLVSGVSFVLFGLAALLLSLTLFPLLHLSAPDRTTGGLRVQAAISRAYRVFLAFPRALGVLSWEVRGAEALRQPGRLIVANHPTLLDIVFLVALLPQADCIVKQGITRNPFLRHAVRWAGYLSNADPDGLVDDCAARLRAGRILVVFPEGTRTVPGQAPHFQRGAARIALAAGCEVLPVQLRCDPPTLAKRVPWYRIPPRPFHWSAEVGAPIAFDARGLAAPLAARRLTRLMEQCLAVEPAPAAAATPSLPGLQLEASR